MDKSPPCPWCGEPSQWHYITDSGYICPDCYRAWVEENTEE